VAVPVLSQTDFLSACERVCMTSLPGSAGSLTLCILHYVPVARDAGERASEPRPPEPRERCCCLQCSV